MVPYCPLLLGAKLHQEKRPACLLWLRAGKVSWGRRWRKQGTLCMELALIWSTPRTALSVRSRPYLSWLLRCSAAAPAVPLSLHHWAGRGELFLISRPVAGKAWHFMGLFLPLRQAVVWTATWTNLLGHAGFKASRLAEKQSLPSHWGILSRHAEERILGLRKRTERVEGSWPPFHWTAGFPGSRKNHTLGTVVYSVHHPEWKVLAWEQIS